MVADEEEYKGNEIKLVPSAAALEQDQTLMMGLDLDEGSGQ